MPGIAVNFIFVGPQTSPFELCEIEIVPETFDGLVKVPLTTAVVIVLLEVPGSICFEVAMNEPFGATMTDLIVALASGAPYGSTPTGHAARPKQPSGPS